MQHSVLVSVMQFSYLFKNVLKLLFCLPILDFTETVNLVELIITAENHNTNWLNSKKITINPNEKKIETQQGHHTKLTNE